MMLLWMHSREDVPGLCILCLLLLLLSMVVKATALRNCTPLLLLKKVKSKVGHRLSLFCMYITKTYSLWDTRGCKSFVYDHYHYKNSWLPLFLWCSVLRYVYIANIVIANVVIIFLIVLAVSCLSVGEKMSSKSVIWQFSVTLL